MKGTAVLLLGRCWWREKFVLEMFRGARRVVEVKEKRSPHGSEKTFATGSKSHNKEKYLQPMHLPTPTIFFFVLHMPLAVAQLFGGEKKICSAVMMVLDQPKPLCFKKLSIYKSTFCAVLKNLKIELNCIFD